MLEQSSWHWGPGVSVLCLLITQVPYFFDHHTQTEFYACVCVGGASNVLTTIKYSS